MASGAGFSARHFCVLAAIIPIHDDDTPDALQARANSAGMLSDFIALRKEHRSDGLRLLGRLRALRLRVRVSDGCLVCPAEDDSGEVLLLPDEAFGVTIDMVALEVFAKRDVRRSLNAEEVLREMSSTCLAGGKNFGAVHLRQVQARLLPPPSDGDVGSAASAVETVPSLAALLYRIASDYDNLSTVHGVSRNIIKALPGLRPWPSPTEIMKFAAGDLPHLVVPYCRHALRALPELHVESSCFAYDNATVLGDGTTKVEFRCARSAAIQNSKSKGKCGSGEAGSGDISDDETAGEGSLAMQDALLSKDGSADDECCEVDGAVRDVEESAPLPQSSHGASAGDSATPPEVRRQLFSESFAAAAGKAALGLRSADAPLTAPPTQIYKQDCSAGLHAYVPPRALAGASMLLTRRHSPGADAAVIRHCHRLDEHLPLSDLLEQAVVLGIKKAGSFTKGSLECQRWLEEVLPQIGAWHVNETSRGVYVRLMRPGPVCHLAERNYREYAGSSFRERPALKLSAICGTAEALSPAGFGRQRRGRHAPHELDAKASTAAVLPDCACCKLPLTTASPERLCMASDCSNPHFHASCAVDLDTDATADNETWLCPDCDARDADPLDSEPDIAELLAATMLTPEEHAALLSRGRVPVADVPTVLGLPRALSRHKPDDVTQPALAALIKNVARFWRHNMCVKDVLLQIVQQRVDAGMGERDAVKDADGSYKRFRAVFIDQPMREALYTLPDLGDDVSVADDTWHMIGRISNMNMYAALSPVAAAGGATMPTLIMLYMTGSGVAGDKADAISFAHAYLHKVRTELYKMRAQAHLDFASSAQSATATQPPPPQPPHPPLPLPTVRLFDKDASSFLSHLNDCKKLAGSHDAREAFDAIAAQLEVLAAGATDEEKAAGKFVLESLPGVDADGVPVAADVVPPKPSALKSQWPTVSHRPWSDQRHALKEVFNGIAVDAYGPYMRGIAYATLAALRTGVAAVHAASTSGDVNVAAARLLPVFLLFARDSAAADMLRRYYMHTVLLCDFHAWQAIERKLGGIDRDLRSAVKDGLHEVFADPAGANGPAWAAFQARFCELANVHVALDSAETGGSGGGAKRMLLFEYIKTYWLSPRWWTTVSVRFRALFQRAGLNTTNDVELFWNTLKKSWLRNMRAGNTEVALARVTAGPGGSPAEVAAAVARSYTGQRWSNIKAMLEGKVRLYPRAHRVQMVDAIAVVLSRLRIGSSVVEEEDSGAFLTMGNASGGFVFRERDAIVHDVSRVGQTGLRAAGLVAVNAASEVTLRSQSYGRGTQACVGEARHIAFRAAAGDATFTSRSSATALLKLVCGVRRPPEFNALRTTMLSGEQLLQVAESLNPAVISAIFRIEEQPGLQRRMGVAHDVRARISGNQSIRAALLESWAALYRSDFSGECPHFAYIYAILLTMTALQWRTECHRVLVIGERVSLVFGDDLPLGYRVMLARMLPLAEAAADADLLSGVYFGQENRGATSKSKCDRWQQHMTKRGSYNVGQLKFVTDRRNGFVYTPLGPVTMEARFVAMLPAGESNASRINGAEALAFAVCDRIPGFVGLNDSPPGEDERLLVTTWAGPPRIFELCSTLVDTLGGEEKASKVKLCDASVAAAAGPFTRGVLEAVHLLMENDHFVDKVGQCYKPDFKSGGRSRFAQFSVQTLVTAVFGSVNIDGVTVPPQRVYTLALWCDACSCRYIGPLCKHLLAGRIVNLVRKVAPCWHGNAEVLYWGDGPVPSYAVRCFTAQSDAAEPLHDAEAAAAAAEELPALYAAAGHHLALIAERASAATAGNDCDAESESLRVALAGTLASVSTALRSFVKRAEGWSGARIVEPGAASRRGGTLGVFKRRAGSTEEVDTDRATAPQLRDALSPFARLELLVKTHPLSTQAGTASASASGSGSSLPYEVDEGCPPSTAEMHTVAAAAALCAAAPRAATAMRAAAAATRSACGARADAASAALAALPAASGDSAATNPGDLEAAESLTALLGLGSSSPSDVVTGPGTLAAVGVRASRESELLAEPDSRHASDPGFELDSDFLAASRQCSADKPGKRKRC